MLNKVEENTNEIEENKDKKKTKSKIEIIGNVGTTEIMGHKYSTTFFPAMPAYLLTRKIIGVITDKDSISKLCEIEPNGELILELFTYTTRDEQVINKGSFNNIYTGNLKEMMLALHFVFEVNFKDFLGENDTGEGLDLVSLIKQTML